MLSRLIFLSSLLVSLSSLAVTERVANDGQLVMQDVPEIPQTLVEEMNRYQNVRSAPFVDFSKDGNGIYIYTRFADTYQLHRVAKAAGMRTQLTFFKEPISRAVRQPGGDLVAFTMDAGGNEYSQIFLLDPANGESQMLTDGESRNSGIRWSHHGRKIAYSSTKRDGRSNDIWVMDVNNPKNDSLVVEAKDGSWWGASDWDSRNQHLLVGQYVSASDSRVYRVDAASGEKTLLEGNATTPSINYAYAFSDNDAGFFFTTNQKSEFTQLAYREFETNELTLITRDIAWDVDQFVLSKDLSQAAFVVNEDGIDSLYLLDPKSFNFKKVNTIPVGIIRSLAFSPDGQNLAVTLNTAQTPSDVFMLKLSSALDFGELKRWTYSEVGGLDTEKFTLPELIRYKSFDERDIPAFVYKPDKKGPHPVIITIHGGPEAQYRPSFRSTVQTWIDNIGAAVIAPNVRGSSGYGTEYLNLDNGFKREDSVKDIGALLDWIESQPDLDENRVAVIGGSYGGYMVLASAMYYSERLKAAVDVVGISNFVTFLQNTKDYRRDLRRVEYGDERDPEMYEFLQKISPSNNVDKINVPMFVVQGQNDPRVPVTEAEQIVKALRENGKPVWYMNALNEGHGYRKKENRDIYQQAVVLFFRTFL